MIGAGWWSYLHQDEEAGRQSIDRTVLRRVAAYGRPYIGRIVLMLLTILAITGLTLVPPLLMRALIDEALPNRDLSQLNLLAAGMVLVPLLNGLVGVFQRYVSSQIGEGIIFDLRRAVFDHLQRQSLRFFTNSKTGELMARVNNDVVGAQGAITNTVPSLISNSLALVGTLSIMLALEWRLTLLGIAILPLFILPARRVGSLLRRITREGMTLNAQMNGMMNETLNVSGALLVKLFGRERDESRRFRERAVAIRDIGIRQALIGRWFFLGIGLVSSIGTALVFWTGGYLVLTESLTIGTVVAFGTYLMQLYGPIAALTNARVELVTSLVSFERVFEVLDLPPLITEKPGAVAVPDGPVSLEFDDVRFAYPSADKVSLASLEEVATLDTRGGAEVLHGVSFRVEPGQVVALVGTSGSGKSTIAALAPRLYDVDAGAVRLSGIDVRDLTFDSIRDCLGMVTQDGHLFHDTVRENLVLARPDATDGELWEALRQVRLDGLIASLPDGLETVVGERGYRLSGGERQRLTIARLMLARPRVVILDEATAHLDSSSEAAVQAALAEALAGRTALVIAHRLSTIRDADAILVVEAGRVVERGTHAELLSAGGRYAQLYWTQFEDNSEAPVVA
jgi:ATP-binding cassette, subfamily B, bacterial